jgi:hypothetical protein
VTSADLSGKKICWSSGIISTYGAGGKFSSNRSGEGTWSVTAAGVEVNASNGSGHSNIEKMPDGSFKATYVNKKGLEIPTFGKVCN